MNANAPASDGKACVLVVDDSATALYLVQAVFAGAHYDVVTASDGQEGLEKVQERRPDLIVTDSIMPGVDGFAFLRRLREDPATRLIPVIMLTSGDLGDPMFRNNDAQPDAYVTKSAEAGPLLNQARTLLNRQQALL